MGMDHSYIWWTNVTGPQMFIKSVVSSLSDNYNVRLLLPKLCPWPNRMRELIAEAAQSEYALEGYTTDATGDRAALELGRVESVLAGAFCTIFGQSPADRFADIFDQVTYVAEHMVRDHIFEDGNKRTSLIYALSVLRFAGTPVVLSDSPEPKDNQYYAWIQDLVSGNRTTSGLAEELRRGCIAGIGDPSHV